jgi:hypothetical protein
VCISDIKQWRWEGQLPYLVLELKAGVWRTWYVFAASQSAFGEVVQLTLERQWASKGRPVNLIDAQEKQLSDGVKYIDGLRGSSSPQPGAKWGEVKTFNSDSLKAAIQDAWLIVEVRVHWSRPSLLR